MANAQPETSFYVRPTHGGLRCRHSTTPYLCIVHVRKLSWAIAIAKGVTLSRGPLKCLQRVGCVLCYARTCSLLCVYLCQPGCFGRVARKRERRPKISRASRHLCVCVCVCVYVLLLGMDRRCFPWGCSHQQAVADEWQGKVEDVPDDHGCRATCDNTVNESVMSVSRTSAGCNGRR